MSYFDNLDRLNAPDSHVGDKALALLPIAVELLATKDLWVAQWFTMVSDEVLARAAQLGAEPKLRLIYEMHAEYMNLRHKADFNALLAKF